MDLDPYLTTNVLDTFTKSLGIRYHHVDVVVVVGVVGHGINAPRASVGLCVAIFMFVPGSKSVENPCGTFAPG